MSVSAVCSPSAHPQHVSSLLCMHCSLLPHRARCWCLTPSRMELAPWWGNPKGLLPQQPLQAPWWMMMVLGQQVVMHQGPARCCQCHPTATCTASAGPSAQAAQGRLLLLQLDWLPQRRPTWRTIAGTKSALSRLHLVVARSDTCGVFPQPTICCHTTPLHGCVIEPVQSPHSKGSFSAMHLHRSSTCCAAVHPHIHPTLQAVPQDQVHLHQGRQGCA